MPLTPARWKPATEAEPEVGGLGLVYHYMKMDMWEYFNKVTLDPF